MECPSELLLTNSMLPSLSSAISNVVSEDLAVHPTILITTPAWHLNIELVDLYETSDPNDWCNRWCQKASQGSSSLIHSSSLWHFPECSPPLWATWVGTRWPLIVSAAIRKCFHCGSLVSTVLRGWQVVSWGWAFCWCQCCEQQISASLSPDGGRGLW